MEANKQRFSEAPWAKESEKINILIGGAGGIGSWLFFFLSRIGYATSIFDDDIVEATNLGGQLYGKEDIGYSKVRALQKLMQNYAGPVIGSFNNRKIERDSPGYTYCFAAFDNMEARRTLFKIWKNTCEHFSEQGIFIDGRLEAEFFQIYCVTLDKADEYEKYLFDDSEIAEASCSYKQTSHSAAMIAAQMTSFFTNYITNQRMGAEVRSVPFYHEYFIPVHKTIVGDVSRPI